MTETKKSIERALKTVAIMPTCHLSIMIVTKNYIDDYHNGDPEIVTHVKLSKKLQQPIIVMMDEDLTPNEKAQVKHMFQDHNVVTKITFNRQNMRKSTSELLEALKPYAHDEIRTELQP